MIAGEYWKPFRDPQILTSAAVCFISDAPEARIAAVREHLAGHACVEVATATNWPFQHGVVPEVAPGSIVWIRDLHLAFPAGQTSGTRLVLTQSTYQLQRWLDWLDATPGVTIVADAERSSLAQSSPEALAARGPWSRIHVADVDAGAAARRRRAPDDDQRDRGQAFAAGHALHDAFTQPDARRRLDACREALDEDAENPALYLGFASTCMELRLLDAATEALEEADVLAPDWEAVHFERGKLLLRREQTEAAAAAFAAAVRVMPTFATALLNLGGTLGELGRRDEARDALQRALQADPRSHTALNNLGAVYREDGRLDEAAAAFREVIALAPGFVFGYYNLGQTLLLAGEPDAARAAYEEGYARDPQKNVRQACRLAVARAAAGDAAAAEELIAKIVRDVPPDRVAGLLGDAESTLQVLSARRDVDRAGVDRLLTVIRAYSS